MRSFKTLEELNNYIPNCLICNKEMQINIEGMLSSVLPSKPRWSSGMETIRLKMHLKDGTLRSKHKKHSISIELATNLIIDGQDLVNRLRSNYTYVNKMCPTCHFKIQAAYKEGSIKKENCFPPLTLHNEELHYTMRGGKVVDIQKHYGSGGNSATIRLENKYLPPVPWDFDKFKDLAHLNKRLATIKIFH